MENKVMFDRTLLKMGDSVGLTLPPEILNFLGAKPGDNLKVMGDVKKHGKTINIWKEE